jgi:hypothetical protein
LWDSVLENRIRLQKLLVEVNKLPQHNVFDEMKEDGGSQFKDPLNNSKFIVHLQFHIHVIQIYFQIYVMYPRVCKNT